MPTLVHTPYDGSARPFSIGLAPLDIARWIEPDEHLAAHLSRKSELLSARREVVVREEPETRGAQAEVLDLLTRHLVGHFPDLYRRDGGGVRVVPAGVTVVAMDDEPPLVTAARLVQEICA